MTTSRTAPITLTLPVELIAEAKAAVAAGEARSVSAYIATRAGAGATHRRSFLEVLDAWDAAAPPPTQEEQRKADDWVAGVMYHLQQRDTARSSAATNTAA